MSIEHRLASIEHDLVSIKHKLDGLIKMVGAGDNTALLERYTQELATSSDALQQSVYDATTTKPEDLR